MKISNLSKAELQLLIKACDNIHNLRDLNDFFGSSAKMAKVMKLLAQQLDESLDEVEFLTNCYEFNFNNRR